MSEEVSGLMPETCPTCGALPCDWTERSPSVGGRDRELLRRVQAKLANDGIVECGTRLACEISEHFAAIAAALGERKA